jgi:hypothetical protein
MSAQKSVASADIGKWPAVDPNPGGESYGARDYVPDGVARRFDTLMRAAGAFAHPSASEYEVRTDIQCAVRFLSKTVAESTAFPRAEFMSEAFGERLGVSSAPFEEYAKTQRAYYDAWNAYRLKTKTFEDAIEAELSASAGYVQMRAAMEAKRAETAAAEEAARAKKRADKEFAARAVAELRAKEAGKRKHAGA